MFDRDKETHRLLCDKVKTHQRILATNIKKSADLRKPNHGLYKVLEKHTLPDSAVKATTRTHRSKYFSERVFVDDICGASEN